MKTLVFLASVIFPVLCLMDPLSSPGAISELQDLRAHVLKLEQNLEAMQSKSQTQDQKYTALLQNVLLKLSTTSDELSTVKGQLLLTSQELAVLKNDHNSTLRELDSVKAELKTVKDKFPLPISSSRENYTQMGFDINDLKSELRSYKTNMSLFMVDIDGLKSDVLLMEANMSSMKTNLTVTQSKLESIQSEILPMKNMLKSSELQAVKSAQSTLNAKMMDITHNMSLLQQYNDNLIHLVERKGNSSNTVAFQARFSLSSTVKGSHAVRKTLRFDFAPLNEGSGYDVRTGIFTAPVTGIYMFWVKIQTQKKNSYKLSLIKNKRVVIIADDPVAKDDSLTAVIRVQKGEQIWTEVDSSDFVIVGYLSSYYGGILVSAQP